MEHIEGIIAEIFSGTALVIGAVITLIKTIRKKGGKGEKPNDKD